MTRISEPACHTDPLIQMLANKDREWKMMTLLKGLGTLAAAGILVMTCLAAFMIYNAKAGERRIEMDFAPVLVSMEGFRRDNGHYPGNLAELVPKYISGIPKCPSYHNNPFYFVAGDWKGQRYQLTCNAVYVDKLHYDSENRKWFEGS